MRTGNHYKSGGIMALSIAAGAVLGAALDNAALGIAIGLATGVGLAITAGGSGTSDPD